MFAQRIMCSWIGAFGLAAGAFCQSYVQLSIATVGHNTFTSPASINRKGEIAGTYIDQFGYRGFLRDAGGTLTSFDVYGVPDGTKAYSINDQGAITGSYTGFPDAYVRDPVGHITTFAPPGSVRTLALSINAGGVITGSYYETGAPYAAHGFVRRANGELISFDPPGSISTAAYSINANGAITGSYQDVNSFSHGFVRQLSGEIVSFDPPGSFGTAPSSINDAGAITGSYLINNGRSFGFVRDPDGKFISFDPGVTTAPTSINDEGAIAGYYEAGFNDNGVNVIFGQHGFVRSPDGAITSFDPPFCSSNSTSPTSINRQGVITGSCLWSSSTAGGLVGWVRYP
jgi:hypothetical protein